MMTLSRHSGVVRRLMALGLAAAILEGEAPAGDLRASVARATERSTPFQEAGAAPASPAKRRNPYLWPGIGLMAVGTGLVVYGLTHKTLDCAIPTAPFEGRCEYREHQGVAVAGAAVVMAGGLLVGVGEGKKRKIGPALAPVEKGIAAGLSVRF